MRGPWTWQCFQNERAQSALLSLVLTALIGFLLSAPRPANPAGLSPQPQAAEHNPAAVIVERSAADNETVYTVSD